MTLVETPPATFGNLPATVTLTPSVKRVPLCACWPPFDVIPTRWRVRLEGNGIGCGLDEWHTLDPFTDACLWWKELEIPIQYAIFFGLLGVDTPGTSMLTYGKFGTKDLWFYKPLIDFDPLGVNRFERVSIGGLNTCGTIRESPLCLDDTQVQVAYVEPVF